ncbi:ribonuclease HI family protein [Patescibacteria group bacterium]|nr:ribonuclease HI family protein [Patescibacteria group bacterium]MBU1663241.1 ribonuclease HI family protein [Patescibacteria group bacterium]MBU2008052.1 ribonuclease HI family protein [Patescibacteria group bacterium]MBU2233243.1 ribonuclease HI family protein [Patescibacteria group bacterium]MBU2264341.1 ribonuclease HI family protein [Patescibacteria group bacterium]
MTRNKLTIYTDGGSRGNPGPAGIGAVILDKRGCVIEEISEYIGQATNNQAEYKALIAGLAKAKELGALELEVFLDSELVVKQLNREYRVKDKDLAPLFVQIYNISLGFKKIVFKHIFREKNELADKLVNKALDMAGK